MGRARTRTGSQTPQPRRRSVTAGLAVGLLLVAVTGANVASAHPGHKEGGDAGGVGVLINAPDELAGFTPATHWDGSAPVDDQTADLVYAGTGCTPINYLTADVSGRIALVDDNQGQDPTDTCTYTFKQKIEVAERAGAIGLVQVKRDDAAAGRNAVDSGIPGLELRNSDGAPIRDAVLAGETVNATLTDANEAVELADRLSDLPCVDGQAGPFECDGIDLLGFVPLGEFEGDIDARAALGAGASDLWGWTDETSGDEYVIIGKTNGVAFFRVTDPTDPVYLGELANRAVLQLIWHDIKVYDDHAFIVSESNPHGMKVFDLTRLRGVDEPRSWTEDSFYPLPAAAHNVEINTDTGFAYIVGGNAGLVVPDQCLHGLHMVDISTPKLPLFAGCYLEEGGPGTGARVVGGPAEDLSPAAYVHDTQCVVYDGPDERYTGREICFNSAEDKIVIADVTDKLAPVTLGWTDYPMVEYAHQGWLTEDQSYFLVNDEADETTHDINTRTVVLDVTDLENPTLHTEHYHDTRSITHNNYVVGDLVYQSNYTSGLRVLDTTPLYDTEDPALEEVGFFDTFPAHGEPTFDGTWSNYPFFESGTIAVSGIDEGLFLLQLADGSGGGGTDPSDEAGVSIECLDCPLVARAGDDGSARLDVRNTGDIADTYRVHVDDVPDGWTATLAPTSVGPTEPGQGGETSLTVEVPNNARAGSYTVTVTATSSADPEVSASEAVRVEVTRGRPAGAGKGDGGPPGQGGGAGSQAADGTGGARAVMAASDAGLPTVPAAALLALVGLLAAATASRRLAR
jgi:choice-of-anchor B domain-containing protein